ncbi:jg1134 [Pararge aegeria aegeria]|uniref:Jg1134 protein n=1 Tax=Pararge aegeria aegeria TaxID=348720 RepID=A0A8S4S2Z2_9NEOP|nr:jg1134 [Pararge aegeria aegeria]
MESRNRVGRAPRDDETRERCGETTTNESLGAAGMKRPRTVDFGTPYTRTISSSELQSVEITMLMLILQSVSCAGRLSQVV